MHVESQADDDVFIGAGKIKADSNAQSSATGRELIEYSSPNTKITPRSDRLTDPITPQNAQGVLPPEACVFVAKYVEKSVDKNPH